MTITTLRERAGRALLHAGSELAFGQEALERGLATEPAGRVGYSGAQSAAAMARWVDSGLLWLGWHVHPSAIAHALQGDAGPASR